MYGSKDGCVVAAEWERMVGERMNLVDARKPVGYVDQHNRRRCPFENMMTRNRPKNLSTDVKSSKSPLRAVFLE